VRLHVGELRAEELLRAVAGEVFHNIDILTAAVINRSKFEMLRSLFIVS
jgi:hypothetical protein